MKLHTCNWCKRELPTEEYTRRGNGKRRHECKWCRAQAERARYARQADELTQQDLARAERMASDYDPLRPEDFDVSVGNDGRLDPKAAREKRQEYSRSMGEHAAALRAAGERSAAGEDPIAEMPAQLGTYIGNLAEQERRFGNRRLARSISLAEAHEVLALRRFKQAAQQYLSAKITPTGYARTKKPSKMQRTVCALISDLHLGAELHAMDSPMPFRATEEARRLEYVLRQVLDYKTQYRSNSRLALLLNGDLVEGQLMHDLRDGAPLTEQKVIFWRYFREFIGHCAAQFPEVDVYCQPGNHGRDKVRHPGRATSRKWDGHEWEMYWALSQMASELKNVRWTIDFRAVTIVGLHGSNLGLSHGDTEVKLGDPDTKAKDNAAALDRINSTRMYGVEFDAWAFGHFHKPRYQPRRPGVIFNGALVPPNGHARTMGYVGEPTGQWIWEATPGYPIGDLRFIEVGPAQDNDEKLGTMIKPFRFDND